MKRTSIATDLSAAKVVGIWIRVSTEDQVRGDSPEVHEKRARMYAEAREWTVMEVYRLEAVSGKSVIEHPEAKRMLADVRAGRITGLVFSKLARLARNTKELLDLADAFRAANADLISLQESIDTGSPAGRFFFTLLSAMAQWEREEISERIAASVPIRARLGRSTGGAAIYGYQWKDKRLVPDPVEAPVRALMYDLFIEHRRIRSVVQILNERGYRTRAGAKFTSSAVRRCISDPTAKGIHLQNYTRSKGINKPWDLKPREDWVETPVEAIVPVDRWEQVNALLTHRKSPAGKMPGRKSSHLFAGFAYCTCGKKMYVWSNSPKYVCKVCRNKITVADLEAVYRDRLSQFVISPDELAAHDQAAGDVLREKEALLLAAETELKKLEAEDEHLFRLQRGGELTQSDFGRRHRPLSERREQLEDEMPRLRGALDALRIGKAAGSLLGPSSTDLGAHWDRCAIEERRAFVEALTERIVVGKEEVAIHLLNLGLVQQQQEDAKVTMRIDMTVEAAETLALKGLAFLANSPADLDRFLAISGVEGTSLRQSAEDPEFLAAIMDFLLSHEALLTAFCEVESLDAKAIHFARRALPGG